VKLDVCRIESAVPSGSVFMSLHGFAAFIGKPSIIVAHLLKARIVELEDTSIARKQYGNNT
jgi:hypothetical protein